MPYWPVNCDITDLYHGRAQGCPFNFSNCTMNVYVGKQILYMFWLDIAWVLAIIDCVWSCLLLRWEALKAEVLRNVMGVKCDWSFPSRRCIWLPIAAGLYGPYSTYMWPVNGPYSVLDHAHDISGPYSFNHWDNAKLFFVMCKGFLRDIDTNFAYICCGWWKSARHSLLYLLWVVKILAVLYT